MSDLPCTVRCPHLQVDKGPCDGKSMTKRVGAKQECCASTHIEETLLDLVRWHDSHGWYEALVRCAAVRPSADLHDDRPASIDLLAIGPTHAWYYPRQDSALSCRRGQLAVRRIGLNALSGLRKAYPRLDPEGEQCAQLPETTNGVVEHNCVQRTPMPPI